MNLAVFITILSSVIYIILLAIIFRNWKQSSAYLRFSLFLITGTLWLIVGSLSATSISDTPSNDILLTKIDFSLAVLISFFIAVFALHFPRRNLAFTFFKEVLLFLPIIILIGVVWLEKIIKLNEAGSIIYTKWYLVYFIFLLIYFIIIPFKNLIKQRNTTSVIVGQQIKYILIGYSITIGISLGASFYSAMVNRLSNQEFAYVEGITVVFAISSAYAMLRYRFMDVRVVVKKSLVYGVSILSILAIYTLIALTLKTTINESWNINPTWTVAVLIAVVAFGFPPLKKLVEKSVNKIFKGRKSIDLAVKEVREKIIKKTNIQELTHLLAREIKQYLSVKQVKVFVLQKKDSLFINHSDENVNEILSEDKSDIIYLSSKRSEITVYDEVPHLIEEGKGNGWLEKGAKEMKKRNVGVVVPLYVDNELFGLFAISEKEDKSAFTVQDIEYLERVRDQVVPTLANALLYQDAMERIGAVEVT